MEETNSSLKLICYRCNGPLTSQEVYDSCENYRVEYDMFSYLFCKECLDFLLK